MGLFSGIIGGLAPVLGGFFGGPLGASAGSAIGGALGQYSANKEAEEAAMRQMNFQERMRATQYRTAVYDMKEAGLNPAMMYASGGGGAGNLAGASYQPQSTFNPELLNSAVQVAQVANSSKLADAQAKNVDADTVLKLLMPDQVRQDIKLKGAQTYATQTQGNLNQKLETNAMKMLDKIVADTHLSQASATQIQSQNIAIKALSENPETKPIAAILQLLLSR